MNTKINTVIILLTALAIGLSTAPSWAKKGEIIHDAEYYILEAQHGEK